MDRLIEEKPKVLACMHGSSFKGDCTALLRALLEKLVLPRNVD